MYWSPVSWSVIVICMGRAPLFVIVASSVLSGCAKPAPPDAPLDPPTPEHRETRDAPGEIAPRPYTAEQIRAGNPSGRIVVYHLEREGMAPVLQETHFVESDEDGTLMHDIVRSPAGEIVSKEQQRASWDELVRHATFPLAQTTVTTVVAETPAGSFPAKLYVVQREDGVSRFWFADDMPGAPVRYEMELDGEVVMRAMLVEARSAADPAVLYSQLPVDDAAKVGLGFFSHEGKGSKRNHVHGDDFEVVVRTKLTGARWWGLSDATVSPGLANIEAFVVRVHRLDADGPGDVVVEQRYSTADTHPEPTGRVGSGQGEATHGGLEQRHEVAFAQPPTLEPGRYLLSIAAVRTRPGADNWQWQDGHTRAGISWSRPLDQVKWQRIEDVDSAFEVIGTSR